MEDRGLEAHVHVRYYAVVRPSVVCSLSVTFVRPTQAIEIFGNVLRHLVRWPSVDSRQNFTEIVQCEPSVGGVKRKRGSEI